VRSCAWCQSSEHTTRMADQLHLCAHLPSGHRGAIRRAAIASLSAVSNIWACARPSRATANRPRSSCQTSASSKNSCPSPALRGAANAALARVEPPPQPRACDNRADQAQENMPAFRTRNRNHRRALPGPVKCVSSWAEMIDTRSAGHYTGEQLGRTVCSTSSPTLPWPVLWCLFFKDLELICASNGTFVAREDTVQCIAPLSATLEPKQPPYGIEIKTIHLSLQAILSRCCHTVLTCDIHVSAGGRTLQVIFAAKARPFVPRYTAAVVWDETPTVLTLSSLSCLVR